MFNRAKQLVIGGIVTFLLSPVFGSFVRHVLTALSGAMVAGAIITAEQGQAFVDANMPVLSGLVGYAISHYLVVLGAAGAIYVVGQGSSLLEKRSRVRW